MACPGGGMTITRVLLLGLGVDKWPTIPYMPSESDLIYHLSHELSKTLKQLHSVPVDSTPYELSLPFEIMTVKTDK